MAKASQSSSSKRSKSEESAGAETKAAGAGGATAPMLDLEFVRGLIEAVDGSGIDSLEITRAGTRVKIAKTPPSVGGQAVYAPQPSYPQPPAPAPAATPAEAPSGGGQAGAGGATGGAATEDASPASGGGAGLTDITSPMVGTFYRSPAPEAPSYVEVGSKVSKGQTLCILEAMKLMNELESEVDGVVKEILVENAEPVEYGQVLFRIDPNG